MATGKSRSDLISFLDYAKEKGLLKAATAESRKAAVNQVLEILDDDEASDVSLIDVDMVLDRFQTLHSKRYTPESLRTYRARVRNSILDFLRYQANPMDFRPRVSSAPKQPKQLKKLTSGGSGKREIVATPIISKLSTPQVFGTSTLPIPIRHDLTVLIHGLPFDLSEQEARRIANVVLAMAVPSASPG